jgi:hypothetical protein
MKTQFAFLNWIVFVAISGSAVTHAKAVAKAVAAPAAKTQVQSGPARGPASLSAGISDSQKSLEIRGQSRNLSMLLVLKNRHENIDFVKPRETYRTEIQNTQY